MKAVNLHEQRWIAWLRKLKAHLEEQRGRNSELSRHLGVGRQNTWRWFIAGHTKIPAWAAVATNIWFARQQAAQPSLPLAACPPGEGQPAVNCPPGERQVA